MLKQCVCSVSHIIGLNFVANGSSCNFSLCFVDISLLVDGFFTNILLNIYVLLLQSLSNKFKLLNSGVFGIFVAFVFFSKG